MLGCGKEGHILIASIVEVFATFGAIAALVVLGANFGSEKYKVRDGMHHFLTAAAVFTFGAGALYVFAQLLA